MFLDLRFFTTPAERNRLLLLLTYYAAAYVVGTLALLAVLDSLSGRSIISLRPAGMTVLSALMVGTITATVYDYYENGNQRVILTKQNGMGLYSMFLLIVKYTVSYAVLTTLLTLVIQLGNPLAPNKWFNPGALYFSGFVMFGVVALIIKFRELSQERRIVQPKNSINAVRFIVILFLGNLLLRGCHSG